MAINFKDPSVQAALIDFGGSALQGAGSAISSNRNQKNQAALTKQELIDKMLSEQAADDRARAVAGLDATQMDPYAASQHLQRANAVRQVLGGAKQMGHSFDPNTGMGSFQGGFQIPENGFDVSALSPTSLAASAGDFYKNRAMVQPNVSAPDLGAMGLGAPGQAANQAIETQRTGVALPQMQDARAKRQAMIEEQLGGAPAKKKGSGWWKKALAIGGNIALAVGTGGMSIPAQIAINAAGGAGIGALTGGKKGALMGAISGASGPALSASKFVLPKAVNAGSRTVSG